MSAESLLRLEGDESAAELAPARLGFLGVGWIGRNRMEAIARGGVGQVVAIADPSAEMRDAAAAGRPDVVTTASYAELLDQPLDGVVIATPSAMHARQSIEALERGLAVFCQKPLGRTEAEVREVIDAARTADRLLGVDFSYRFVEAFRVVRDIVRSGELGELFSVDLTFHNAYGPDKDWFYDPALAGGGCVMDLGSHLVDQMLWALDAPEIGAISSDLRSGGRPLADPTTQVEDFGVATIEIVDGPTVRLACSWKLQAGREAIISAEFYGTRGGAAVRNVQGSFYDFQAERYRGTSTEVLVGPPDDWGGRAAADWARRLSAGDRFDAEVAAELLAGAALLDRIYGR